MRNTINKMSQFSIVSSEYFNFHDTFLLHPKSGTLKTCKNGERCDAFVEIVPPNEAENRFRFNLRVDHGSPIDYVGVGFSKEDKMASIT